GDAIAAEVDGLARRPHPRGKHRPGWAQRAGAMVVSQVVSGCPLALLKPIVSLKAGFGPGQDSGLILLNLVQRSRRAPDLHIIDLTLKSVPTSRCGRPVRRVASSDHVKPSHDVLNRTHSGPLKPAIQVEALVLRRPARHQSNMVPAAVGDAFSRCDG